MASAVIRKAEEKGGAPLAALGLPQLPATAPKYPLFDRLLTGMVNAGLGIQALCLLLSLTRAAFDDHLVRLGLPTPHDRPMRKSGAKGWSLKDTIRLIIWRLAAVHPEVIGQRLDTPRSANAVRAKARRLGIPSPSRKALHKPAPETLRDPDAAGVMAMLMLAAREPGQSADDTVSKLRRTVIPFPAKDGRTSGKRHEAGGQGTFSFNAMAHDARDIDVSQTETLAVPPTVTLVDFTKPLTWFRTLRGKTKPHTNRTAVWVGFMLLAGGLHFKEAAARLGVSSGAFRTFRTNVSIPSDTDRRKMGSVFDLEAAQITLDRSGYELRRCMMSDNWFWEKKTAKGVRISPPFRRREKIVGERGNRFTIITRAVVDAEKRISTMPFANLGVRVPA